MTADSWGRWPDGDGNVVSEMAARVDGAADLKRWGHVRVGELGRVSDGLQRFHDGSVKPEVGDVAAAAAASTPAPVDAAVLPVLHGVVAAVVEAVGNLRPALAHVGDEALDEAALIVSDGAVAQAGLEVLVVALAALLGQRVCTS